MSGKATAKPETAYVQTREGDVVEVPKAEERAKLESGDYLPATQADKADADKRAASSTFGAKAKTFAESAAAGAIDTIEAPIALPLRASAALWGDKDPLENIHGRKTVENAAAIFGELKNRLGGQPAAGQSSDTGEGYANQYAANARERAEEHPGIVTAGNFTGALAAGGALSGGAGSVGAGAAKALGGGALARAGGALVTGATEGAAYGQAQAGEEAYLHNIPLSGEKLIAAMGWGAVLGGGVSLAAHAGGALLRRGSRGATPLDSPRLPDAGAPDVPTGPLDAADGPVVAGAEESAEAASVTKSAPLDASGLPAEKTSSAADWLRQFSNERALNATGFRGAVGKKLGRTAEAVGEKVEDLGGALKEATLDNGEKVFQPWQTQGQLRDRIGQAYDEANAKLGDFRAKADRVFDAHPELAPHPDAIADRIEKDVIAPLENSPSTIERAQAEPIRQFADDIRGVSARAEAGKSAPGIGDLTRLRQKIDGQIYNLKRGVNLAQQGAPPELADLEKAKWILEDAITASTDKAATHFSKAEAAGYRDLKTQSHLFRLLNDQAGAEEIQASGRRIGSPSDYGAGIAGAALGGGPIGALAAMAANKVVREHSSSVLAVLADKLANNLDGKIESGLGAFFREATARAAAGTAGLDRVASAVPIRRIATPAAVDAFMGRSQNLAAAYDKRVRELADANRDSGAGVRASMQTAMGGGYEAMPRLTQAATVTATRGAQYLQSQLPSGTSAPTVFQPSRKISPSDLQIREFAQKWAAVANPLSVVDDLRRGTVTHAQIDALKNVYPQMYAEVQEKALEKIRDVDASGKRMPFNDRLQLDLFLDLNGAGEPTLSGQFVDRVAGLQAAKAKQDAQQKPHASGGALTKISASRQSGAQTALGG